MGAWRIRMERGMTLESDVLDVGLIQLLTLRYVVEVWAQDGKVFYRLTDKPEPIDNSKTETT